MRFFLCLGNAELRQAVDQIGSGFFSPCNHDEFRDVFNNLMYHDRFFCLADYEEYIAAQDKVNEAYQVAFTFILPQKIAFGLNALPFHLIITI